MTDFSFFLIIRTDSSNYYNYNCSCSSAEIVPYLQGGNICWHLLYISIKYCPLKNNYSTKLHVKQSLTKSQTSACAHHISISWKHAGWKMKLILCLVAQYHTFQLNVLHFWCLQEWLYKDRPRFQLFLSEHNVITTNRTDGQNNESETQFVINCQVFQKVLIQSIYCWWYSSSNLLCTLCKGLTSWPMVALHWHWVMSVLRSPRSTAPFGCPGTFSTWWTRWWWKGKRTTFPAATLLAW